MEGDRTEGVRSTSWRFLLLALGLYLTLKGYHSFDGDQAHRLPILLHALDPDLYADDPFVRSFDDFNPHRGSLVVLGTLARIVGLPATLALLFGVTFALSVRGIHRLAEIGRPGAGWAAVLLFLAAKAGNIGTNHLFESMMLDRLTALALAWVAAAAVVENPRRGWAGAALALGAAAWIHPSMGLQLALVFSGTWFAWAAFASSRCVTWTLAFRAVAVTGLAVIPGLVENLAPFGNLREGLSPETFRLLTVELQSPQHMLPHLWRQPQWLAAGAYLALAAISLVSLRGPEREPEATDDRGPRLRLILMLGGVLVWLAGSWAAVEVVRHVGATVFQPFRIATFGRGLCLVLASAHVVALWRRGGVTDRLRAVLLSAGCTGDWLFVTVVGVEVVMTMVEACGDRIPAIGRTVLLFALLGCSGMFLAKHDTERGGRTLAAAVVAGTALGLLGRASWTPSIGWTARRYRFAATAAWAVPIGALAVGLIPEGHPVANSKIARALTARCRFAPRPVDDEEALAVWCRENTPASARFIGPPGPKGFRLWSRRNWAFNRAGSPYHAKGLRDWYERFRDHVDFDGTPEGFVRAYLDGRHRLEARYDAMTDEELAGLAARQGAGYVVAAPRPQGGAGGPLQLLHEQGRFAVYRLRTVGVVQVQR